MKPYAERSLRAEKQAIARRKLKLQAVDYKGGSCEGCGYNKCLDALSFHHSDPLHKDFMISQAKLTKNSFESIRAELDRCELLCCNCHAEAHYWLRAEGKLDNYDLAGFSLE